MLNLNTPEIQAVREQFRQNLQTQKMSLKAAAPKPRLTKEEKKQLALKGKQ